MSNSSARCARRSARTTTSCWTAGSRWSRSTSSTSPTASPSTGRAGSRNACMPDRIDSYRADQGAQDQHPALRRRARIHALGLQALHRRERARYPAARHLLVRRPVGDTEDRGLRDGARPHHHPARPFDAGRHPFLGHPVADPHAVSGIPGQVERRSISTSSRIRSSRCAGRSVCRTFRDSAWISIRRRSNRRKKSSRRDGTKSKYSLS